MGILYKFALILMITISTPLKILLSKHMVAYFNPTVFVAEASNFVEQTHEAGSS